MTGTDRYANDNRDPFATLAGARLELLRARAELLGQDPDRMSAARRRARRAALDRLEELLRDAGRLLDC